MGRKLLDKTDNLEYIHKYVSTQNCVLYARLKGGADHTVIDYLVRDSTAFNQGLFRTLGA
jgi:hypothetical protein